METTLQMNSIKQYPFELEVSKLYELLSSIYLSQEVQRPKIKGTMINFQLLKNKSNMLNLQIKGTKYFSNMEYAASREIKLRKVHKLLGRAKYIQNFQMEYLPQRGIQSVYKCVSKKVQGLECSRIESLSKLQREVVVTKLKEFKFIQKMAFQTLPDYRTIEEKESRAFKSSVRCLTRLKDLSFPGETSPKAIADILRFCLPSQRNLESLTVSFNWLPLEKFRSLHKSLEKLTSLKTFKIQIPEQYINEELNEMMNEWLASLIYVEKGILCISSSTLEKDLSCYSSYSFLEIRFKLNHGLSTIAPNVTNLDRLSNPLSFEWNIIPTETLDYKSTQAIISKMSQYSKLISFNQSYSFDIENSNLTQCYPLWADIMTHPNFQKVERMNLSVLLYPSNVQKFCNIFELSVKNMKNLKDLCLTLHNDGSSEQRFYIQEEFIPVLQALRELPELSQLEFNTEVEIIIHVLNSFFKELTHFSNLKVFKSEWLQVSKNSFKTFMTKLFQMANLERLETHIYSLTDIKEEEMVDIFNSLDTSLAKMKNMMRVQITGDSDCFGNGEVWTSYEAALRKSYSTKVIELSLAQTE